MPRSPLAPSTASAYIFLDNFSLTESTCTDCVPHGPIAYNQEMPDRFAPNYTATRDYEADYYCVKNINNATYGRMDIFDPRGTLVDYDEFHFPSGSVNAELCWEGFKTSGTPVTVTEVYQSVITLANCDEEITFINDVVLFPVTPPGAIPAPSLQTYGPVASYIPPAIGAPPSPYATRDLYLYGGPYTAGYVWQACNNIYAGDPGNPITPFFKAGAGSLIVMEAGNAVYLTPGYSAAAGSTVSVGINPLLQCCPFLRTEGLSDSPRVAMLSSEEGAGYQSQPEQAEQEFHGDIQVFPNPFSDQITLRIPETLHQDSFQFQMWDMLGQSVLQIAFARADEITLEAQGLGVGLYQWQLKAGADVLSSGKLLKYSP